MSEDLNEIIREVYEFYEDAQNKLRKRQEKNKKIIEENNDMKSKININIDHISKEIKAIEDDKNNYYNGNTEFSLLIEKEKEIKKLYKRLEDFNQEKEKFGPLFDEIEKKLLKLINNDEDTIQKFDKEKLKIVNSIINKEFYKKGIELRIDSELYERIQKENNDAMKNNE